MEPVLPTPENCTLHSGQDQGHVDIKETRVDTFGKDVIILLLLNLITALDVFLSYFSFVWFMICFGWRYTQGYSLI